MVKLGRKRLCFAFCNVASVGFGFGLSAANVSPTLAEPCRVATEADFNVGAGTPSVGTAVLGDYECENSGNSETLALASEGAPLDLSPLPTGEEKLAEPIPHFPNRTAAFVWRNWNLATLEAMARTLETTPEKIAQIAELLGLPPYCAPTWEPDRVYITLTRRNWSILPYEQMLTLLDLEPTEYAEKLREDDFLWVKLGRLKPVCETLRFEEPTEADVAAMRKIAADVRETLGDELDAPETPRFAFLDELGRVDGGKGENEEETANKEEAAENGEFNVVATAGKNEESGAKNDSQFEICYLHSYFAVFGDPLLQDDAKLCPDGLLQKLSERGVNGVWLHALLRDLAPPTDEFPELGAKSDVRRATLRNLVKRAKKYGIDVYLYMNEPRALPAPFFEDRPHIRGVAQEKYFAMCASAPETRRWLVDSLAAVFADVPGLGGIFTISGSENLTTCASHMRQDECPRCSKRDYVDLIADLNAAMAEGVWRSAPDAKVIVWDWGWRGHGLATDIVERLPKGVWLQSVSEWALPLNRGGVPVSVGEYSISAVGPGPRAVEHWAAAKKAGLKTIAKCQFNATWEIASIPTIPALDLVVRHAANLSRSGVDGVMAGWSLGGFPSINLEALQEFKDETTTEAEALDRLAERVFGAEGAATGRAGWTKVSRAFEEFPYSGAVVYNAPNQIGPANLLRLEPTGFRATMVGIPYDDVASWTAPYPPLVFAEQMEKCGRGFREGAALLTEAAKSAPAERRVEAERQARCADVAGVVYLSCANQARFVLLRDERIALRKAEEENAGKAEDSEKAARLTAVEAEMAAIVRDEIELAKALRRAASTDSCVGFESTNQYWFVPNDLVEKIISCRQILGELEK
ncbi:MAG: hypothetical protein IJO40_07275 [Thermoguttaceae bacterium]|nr:hypothetical protein [Thermoguttaceae bacterium]